MTRLKSIDTSKWSEVSCINNYAVFMGHLSMGVRGLGFLVFTWTTVVLLGGFVSTLQKKDFWCLTAIALVQVAGVFDASMKEKLVNIRYAYRGLVSSVKLTVMTKGPDPTRVFLFFNSAILRLVFRIIEGPRRCQCFHDTAQFCAFAWDWLCIFYGVVVQIAVVAIQTLVFAIILCPLAALYMFGLCISAAVSLWRLVERDYIIVVVVSDAASARAVDPSKANMKPALDVVYSLALAQGVLFCYKTIIALAEKKIMQEVADDYRLEELARDPLLDYLEETRIGCGKDVSFARGRNLIAYAIELMDSKSPDRYISGTRIVDALICLQAPPSSSSGEGGGGSPQLLEQHRLMKQLLTGDIVHKLVQTVSLRSPYDRKTRLCAARILAHVAGEIHLEELPRGMHCVSSLLVTFQVYSTMETFERDWRLERHGTLVVAGGELTDRTTTTDERDAGGYKELVLLGLRIVSKLAADEDNWRIMSRDIDGLLAMIMAPVNSNGQFHVDHHGEWTAIADGLFQLISRLMPALAKSERIHSKSHDKLQLQRQIANTKQVLINTIASILMCPECHDMYKQAVESLLLDIHLHTSSDLASESRENFIDGLLSIFVDEEKRSSIRELAGKLLSSESESEGIAKIILEQDYKSRDGTNLCDVLRNAKNSVCRIHAADILKHLCTHYTNDDELLKYLKGAMTDSIKKLLNEILPKESDGEEIQAVTEGSNNKFSAPDTDVEAQLSGLNSQDTKQQNYNSASSRHDQTGERISEAMKMVLQAALISLCETICDTWISADPDLGCKLYEIAREFCSEQGRPVSIFSTLVKEAQDRLDRKKAQESAINVSASSSSTAT